MSIIRESLVGEEWYDEHGAVRICALVEGYIVARRSGCVPFIESPAMFVERFVRSPEPQSDNANQT